MARTRLESPSGQGDLLIRTHLQPLAERNFRLLFVARAASSFGDGIGLVALTFAVLSFGSAGDLALVLLAREVPTVALLLIGGVWADRLPRQRLLFTSDLARFVSQAATAALVFAGTAGTGSVALLQVVYGVGTAFFLPASTSLVPQTVSPEHLQKANALLSFSRNGSGIVGPMVGSLIVIAASPAWGLTADALTFLTAAFAILLLRIPRGRRKEGARLLDGLREGWKEFTARTWVWTISASFGVFQLAVMPAFFVLGPVIALHDLGGAGAWGAVLAASSAGSVVGSLAALRINSRRPLVLGQILILPIAVLFALLGASASVVVIIGASAISWACSEIGDTLWITTLQRHVPEDALGRISSFDYFGSQALRPVGYAVIGTVSAAVGVSAVMYGAAGLLAVIAAALLLVPSVRRVGGEPVD